MRVAVLLMLATLLRAQDAQLEHARSVNLARAANLPNFVADEIAVRYRSRTYSAPIWERVDTIESEISVHGSGFTRHHTRVNGKPWNKPNLPAGVWRSVLFGDELKPLFSPDCNTEIQYTGSTETGGRRTLEYQFRSAPGGCFGGFSARTGVLGLLRTASPARAGKFTIDDPDGNLISFEIDATDFPKDFDVRSAKGINTWDYVKIGDASYLLPVSFEFFTDSRQTGLWRVGVEYKNHRHFESSSNLTFK